MPPEQRLRECIFVDGADGARISQFRADSADLNAGADGIRRSQDKLLNMEISEYKSRDMADWLC